MSSVAFPGINVTSDSQLNATARTGPAQVQTVGQDVDQKVDQPTPARSQDTVKISAAAQAQAMHQSGQSVSSIASTLGTTVSTVDSYLGITATAVSSAAAISTAEASTSKSTSASTTSTASAKVSVKA
jgi:hypothetical protein